MRETWIKLNPLFLYINFEYIKLNVNFDEIKEYEINNNNNNQEEQEKINIILYGKINIHV